MNAVTNLWMFAVVGVLLTLVLPYHVESFTRTCFLTPLKQSIALPHTTSRQVLRKISNTDTDTTNNNDSTNTNNGFEYALLFDCDGVILETEELHRQAYNEAFQQFELQINNETVFWSVEYYDILQNSIGGGKPKMRYYFRNTTQKFPIWNGHWNNRPPQTEQEENELIDAIQDCKTEIYKTYIEEREKPRPGILRLMDEALADPSIAVGVCSASTREAAEKVLQVTLGDHRVQQLNVCILGDDVSEKKPSPMIYNVARQRIGIIDSHRCVVIEDSIVGLRAAKAANMKCIITYTSSTANQDFYMEGAQATLPDLQSRNVTLDNIFGPLRRNGLDAEMLVGIKDPMVEERTTITS